MRLGLISDIHGNPVALRGVLGRLNGEVDQILFLGDIAGYYPFVDECIELLAPFQVTGVRGNHDEVLLQCLIDGVLPTDEYSASYGSALERSLESISAEARDFIAGLPLQSHAVWGGVSISMYHGAPWDLLEGRIYPDFAEWNRFSAEAASVVALGHTHYPLLHQLHGAVIVNPGSVGQPRDRSALAAFAILDVESMSITGHRLPFDPSRLVVDARRHDPQLPYLVDVLSR
jgi:predicted phosphodiesterase